MHPRLAAIPFAFFHLVVAVNVVDALGWLAFGESARLVLVATGGAVALLAVVTGAIDLAALPNKTHFRAFTTFHAFFGVGFVGLCALSFWSHWNSMPWAAWIDLAGMVAIILQCQMGVVISRRHGIQIVGKAKDADLVPLRPT